MFFEKLVDELLFFNFLTYTYSSITIYFLKFFYTGLFIPIITETLLLNSEIPCLVLKLLCPLIENFWNTEHFNLIVFIINSEIYCHPSSFKQIQLYTYIAILLVLLIFRIL